MTAPLLFIAKLSLVAATVWLASYVARRFGHATGGVMAGLPMNVGPITAILLIDLPTEVVSDVCLATIACQPALMVYLVCNAHLSRRFPWWVCLSGALAAFTAVGFLLLALHLPGWASILLALSSPWWGALAVSAINCAASSGPVTLPTVELVARMGVAVAVAAGVMAGASQLRPDLAGLLMAAPIAGLVLPSFTLSQHGKTATVQLIGGFIRGQLGFVAFLVILVCALPRMPAAWAWLLAMTSPALLYVRWSTFTKS
ncbi:MAG: hypothetical protein EB072_17790 [Betaproteobacteria bacterium]|nr:hypothetical protein [Betaproteobacteria bacterium]